jgi:hypothetical protein
MPTSVRLDARTERLIRQLAKRRGQTKSELIRLAIESLASEAADARPKAGRSPTTPSAYDRLAYIIGVADSGGAALSERTGERFRNLLITRPRGRRPR